MWVARIRPTHVGCQFVSQVSQRSDAPHSSRRVRWRSSQLVQINCEKEPAMKMNTTPLGVKTNVAAVTLGGGYSSPSGTPPPGGPTCSSSTSSSRRSSTRTCPTPPSWTTRSSRSFLSTQFGSSSLEVAEMKLKAKMTNDMMKLIFL